jgi:uncharacterized protein
MRILLPPSEAKHAGGRGRSLASRGHRQPIDGVRRQTFEALARLLATPAAASSLLLPPSVAEAAISQNLAVRTSPTMPAVRRYAGIVYEGLGFTELPLPVQALANRQLLIFSGLFGVLTGAEPVPAYRVPAKAALPGLGILATFWRPRLGELMPAMLGRSGLILDLRSTDYAAMWQPEAGTKLAARLLTVRVRSVRPDGSYGVISYSSKLAKGRLAAAILRAQADGRTVRGAADVAAIWTELGGTGAEAVPARTGYTLDLFEADARPR